MANNFNFQPINSQPQPIQPMQSAQLMQQNSILFPQPIGSVYNLNTASDIGNIPTGANLQDSCLCMSIETSQTQSIPHQQNEANKD